MHKWIKRTGRNGSRAEPSEATVWAIVDWVVTEILTQCGPRRCQQSTLSLLRGASSAYRTTPWASTALRTQTAHDLAGSQTQPLNALPLPASQSTLRSSLQPEATSRIVLKLQWETMQADLVLLCTHQ